MFNTTVFMSAATNVPMSAIMGADTSDMELATSRHGVGLATSRHGVSD